MKNGIIPFTSKLKQKLIWGISLKQNTETIKLERITMYYITIIKLMIFHEVLNIVNDIWWHPEPMGGPASPAILIWAREYHVRHFLSSSSTSYCLWADRICDLGSDYSFSNEIWESWLASIGLLLLLLDFLIHNGLKLKKSVNVTSPKTQQTGA